MPIESWPILGLYVSLRSLPARNYHKRSIQPFDMTGDTFRGSELRLTRSSAIEGDIISVLQ